MTKPARLFYRVVADPAAGDRWFLDEPFTTAGDSIDARAFLSGCPYTGLLPSNVPIQVSGRQVKFNFAAFDMPVVSQEIGEILTEIAPQEIELYPVTVDANIRGFEILNITSTQDCLDEMRSDILKWGTEDGRPEKVGQYRMVTNLNIDPQRTNQKNLFRIGGWKIALIVSEMVKVTLEHFENLGIVFEPVIRGIIGDS